MLWLCVSLPQLPLEALCLEGTDDLMVVTDCEANARWIVCCNAAADRANLRVGMSYATALAIHSSISMFERKRQAEKAALERLAAWAYQFSSMVIIGEAPAELRRARTAALWLEIGASLKLFDGFKKFIGTFEVAFKELHYSYQLGVAPTLEGAALLARADIRLASTTILALRARIEKLPVAQLTVASEVAQQLHMVGIRTIGAVLELPRGSIARRFGVHASNYLDRLIGDAPDPRVPFKLPHRYSAQLDLGFDMVSTEVLLFPLRRMLCEFAGFLLARDTAVQHFNLTFSHRECTPTALTLGVSLPDRNSERFFDIVREQLERITLPAPTMKITLTATDFVSPTALQTDLLNGTLDQAEELSHTIDRIAARLGKDHVFGIRMVADHRPEASWTIATGSALDSSLRFPDRPLWLLAEPKPLRNSALRTNAGPERIESGWWEDKNVQRDYYVVRTNVGADLWVYRDLHDSNWYLHGIWS